MLQISTCSHVNPTPGVYNQGRIFGKGCYGQL